MSERGFERAWVCDKAIAYADSDCSEDDKIQDEDDLANGQEAIKGMRLSVRVKEESKSPCSH